MSSDDEAIVSALCALDRRVGWLFPVASTWGPSPRPAGSLLLIDADGRETGSVSGGCVEADLVERCRGGTFDVDCPMQLSYGVDADDARRFGLPCGGRLDLIVERVDDPGPWRPLRSR